jgi:type IV pilus assembly protein PilM
LSQAIVSRGLVRPAFFDGLLCRVPCFVLSFQGLFPVTTTIAMAEGKNLVGVDIGASSIKVVQLKEARKKLQIVRWGMAPLPPQTIIDGHVMNAGAVTETLARIFQDAKIQQRDVAIGVYGQSVIVRKITVPMMTSAELDEQIHWEAEQHIPFDIKLMSIDYEVLRKRPEAGQMDLLLVAAKKDEISDYASIIREAKLKPTVVDINAFTIQNIFEHQYGLPPDGTIALLNVGAAISSLNIVSKGVSAFTREITNAGNAITEEIRKSLACSYEQAEAYKMGGGPTQIVPQEVMQLVNQACQGLAGEIQRSLDFYLATSGEQEIGRIYVSGGSAYLAPLTQAVERRARVPVQLFDPMVNLAVDPKFVNEPLLRSLSAQMVVALGLSLRCDKERRQWSA